MISLTPALIHFKVLTLILTTLLLHCGCSGTLAAPSSAPLFLCHVHVSKQQFSIDIVDKAANVCLAHLFTYQDFDEGTLGLAYVAPSKPDIAGGLCSKGTTTV